MSLPRLDTTWIKRLETLFLKFIWGGENDKIARKSMQLDLERGGCRMINIIIFTKSLLLQCNMDKTIAHQKFRMVKQINRNNTM